MILYKLTIGHTLKIIETKIQNFNSKENVEQIKEKVRNEIKDGLNKDRYLTNEDAKLINDFLNKIKKELKTK